VHLALFPELDEIAAKDTAVLEEWQNLLFIRDGVLKSLEQARKEKRIGKALEASIKLVGNSSNLGVLEKYEGSLKELFNVSQVILASAHIQGESVHEAPDEGLDLWLVETADGIKCERCWNYRTDTAQFGPWSTVCGRCADALRQMPEFAPFEQAGSVNA
jgi:isoleucyl-tRNA synthetase